MNETKQIKAAKQLMKDNGYIVARCAHPYWEKKAYRMNDEWVAFRLRGAVEAAPKEHKLKKKRRKSKGIVD